MVNKKYLYIGAGIVVLLALAYATFSFIGTFTYDEDERNVLYCTEEQKAAQACTMEYAPVCGFKTDGTSRTYGNACVACSGGEIEYYIQNEC